MKIVYKTPGQFMFLWLCYLSELGGQPQDLTKRTLTTHKKS